MRFFDDFRIFTAVLLIVLGVLIYVDYQEQKHWDAFSAEHACKIVAVASGTYNTGIASNGTTAQIYNPGTTSFLCNDGITYTRSN